MLGGVRTVGLCYFGRVNAMQPYAAPPSRRVLLLDLGIDGISVYDVISHDLVGAPFP